MTDARKPPNRIKNKTLRVFIDFDPRLWKPFEFQKSLGEKSKKKTVHMLTIQYVAARMQKVCTRQTV